MDTGLNKIRIIIANHCLVCDICCVFPNVAVPKSQPIAYAQLAFYLHRLGNTDAVTATIEVSFCQNLCTEAGNRHTHTHV